MFSCLNEVNNDESFMNSYGGKQHADDHAFEQPLAGDLQ
jgi:hypothetical protein